MRILICFCLFITSNIAVAALDWQQIKPGLSYTKVILDENRAWKKIHAFKINPKKYQFIMAMARDNHQKRLTVKEFAKLHRALIAINGGFFNSSGDPIGLRIANGKVKQGLHGTSWWGVFYIQRQKPRLVPPKAYRYRKNINFAIQSGPRLIVNGEIPKLKYGEDQRTALGITKDNKIIIVVTEHKAITTTLLAKIMRDLLNCRYALNLDGGSSSQLYVNIDALKLYVPGLSSVSDAVLVRGM